MGKLWATVCFAALFFLSACKERPIEIPNLSVGKRRVLVEEATGVKCSNCPDGTRTLVSLQGNYAIKGRELIVVSIHAAGPFSVPYASSLENYWNADAQGVVDYIGSLEGFPSASINRKLLTGEPSCFINPNSRWEGVINAEFAKDYGLDIFLAHDYDSITRQLSIYADIVPDQTLTGENRITVLITQDSIVDVQNDNDVIKPNYIHRHVLRDVLTNVGGDVIAEPLVTGAIVHKEFSVVLPAKWNEKHCSVVAYVHHGGNPDKEVLQAAEKHVIE